MKKFRFRQFLVYQDGLVFNREIKSLCKNCFPKTEQRSLTSQLYRALDSIILNIAEGSDRGTDKDFAHFLNLSHASLNEVVACLDIALDNKYIVESEQLFFLEKAAGLADQITAF